MTIADDYLRDTGETVGQAVARLHKHMGVEQAAQFIGYSTSTDLRKYLNRRGIEDPWPLGRKPNHSPINPDEVLRWAELRHRKRMSSRQAAAVIGRHRSSIEAAYRRMCAGSFTDQTG